MYPVLKLRRSATRAPPRLLWPAGVYVCLAVAPVVAAPLYTRDIAPFLDRHCVECHRPNGSAWALPLNSYETARKQAVAMKQAVRRRVMPPWPADPDRSVKFRNDRRLSADDIEMLTAWVDSGASRGEAVSSVSTAPGWRGPNGRAPDVVITLPEFTAPATGEIPYVVRRVKVPLTEDKWIAALQVLPGNEALVHHMGVTEVALNDGMLLKEADAFEALAVKAGLEDPLSAISRPAVSDPMNPRAYDMLGVYTPGTSLESYAPDGAKLLKAGSNNYVNFNIHYTTIGVQATDRSRLALWFQPNSPARQLFRSPSAVDTLIANGRELLTDDPGTSAEGTDVAIPPIRPGVSDYELIGMTAYTEPVTIHQLQPHAHMRGKSFTYAVVYADGREQTLLTVPNYDFHWQFAYELDQPLRLPAGSKLIVTAVYDNSSGNPHLKNLTGDVARNCGPDKDAYFRRQNQTWHEMFSPLVQYSIDRIAVDSGKSGVRALRIIDSVGCLAHEATPGTEWSLTNASAPTPSETQSTSAAETATHARLALSNRRYLLVGARFFRPDRYTNRKVDVKGVLIDDGPRLNVTSLQPLAGPCH